MMQGSADFLRKRKRTAMRRPRKLTKDMAEGLAVQALTFVAAEPERLGRFLAVSGIGPDSLRAAADQPDFLAGVLEYLLADERLLLDFAAEAGIDPAEAGRARELLAGRSWERDLP
jgi:hypothetical protein